MPSLPAGGLRASSAPKVAESLDQPTGCRDVAASFQNSPPRPRFDLPSSKAKNPVIGEGVARRRLGRSNKRSLDGFERVIC
jgi:hypothetical protein